MVPEHNNKILQKSQSKPDGKEGVDWKKEGVDRTCTIGSPKNTADRYIHK